MVAAVITPERNLMIVKPGKPVESIEDKLFRLYAKALEEGVQIFTDGDTETKYATSGTMPGLIYRVSDHGCSCQGYASFRRCKHFALYLEHVGKRPATDAEMTAAVAELDRLRSLRDRNQLKSTRDWRRLQEASLRVDRFEANKIVLADLPPAA